MLDSVFIDKATGEQVRIVNEDVNFYVLDNNVSIKKDVFNRKYEQSVEIDPNTFFQPKLSSDPLLNLAKQLKNMDTSKISDTQDSGARVKYISQPVVLSDNSGAAQQAIKQPQSEEQIQLSPEEKRKMMEEWRRTQPGAQIPEIQNKNWDEEEDRFLNGDKPIQVKESEPKVDPIQMMFKMFKNNYPVKLNIEIEEKIPNPTFIGMVQENVEADAVEYYANLISDKFLKDPTKLKIEIYNQLKRIINKELGIEYVVEEKK